MEKLLCSDSDANTRQGWTVKFHRHTNILLAYLDTCGRKLHNKVHFVKMYL